MGRVMRGDGNCVIITFMTYDLYFSPNIFWVITSRRMRWAGHEARMV